MVRPRRAWASFFRRSKEVAEEDLRLLYLALRKHFMTQVVDFKEPTAADDLLAKASQRYSTILADPPWQFQNMTGKMAPEHKRLLRYPTMELKDIKALPIPSLAAPNSHLYLWVPNALLQEGLDVMAAWGFTYKSNLVWYKIRKDGGPDWRGVGFYFRNVTEIVVFGVRGEEPKSTFSPPKKGSTAENPTRFTTSSNRVLPVPIWNCSHAFIVKDGISGAMKMLKKIHYAYNRKGS